MQQGGPLLADLGGAADVDLGAGSRPGEGCLGVTLAVESGEIIEMGIQAGTREQQS